MTEQIKPESQNLESLAVKANLSNAEREYFDKLKAELKEILGGKTLDDIERTQDLVLARRVNKKMGQILSFLKSKEVETKELIIKDAKNPFAEAFEDGGADAPEEIKYELNFEELADMNAKVYESCGLPEWAEDVRKAQEKLGKMSLEKLEIIKQEIKEGAIPIIMPGKRVMLETTLKQIKMLRPKFKNLNKEEELADESSLVGEHLNQLINERNELLVSDIPEKPYILLTRPTQKSEIRNKTVAQQIAALEALNENRTGESKIYAMNPHEYAATQTVRSELIFKRGEETDVELVQIKPMDFIGETWTRFVSLPVFSGAVPFGFWAQDDSRLVFVNFSVDAYARAGVRLSVRVVF
ncbi:hypothetical protein KKC32_04935 [Patescibacteria group bacterium]|nr:hypothetical protein [Patescibacteria group bacterium]